MIEVLNGNSTYGDSAGSVAGVPDPLGARLGEPRPWRLFSVVW